MAIFKKGKNWYIDYYLNGKRKREMIGGSHKLAERVLDKRKVQIVEGKFFDIEKFQRIRLSEFSQIFLNSYSKPNKLSWKTDEYYIKTLLAYFSDVFIDEITSLSIEEFKKWRLEQNVKPSTVNRDLTCLRTMLYKAVEWGYLKENPIQRVKLYKENQRVRFLEKEEIERLLNACSPHTRNMVVFALNTGMRRGEIFNLKWSNVDLINKHIYLYKTKSKENRVVPMNRIVERLHVNIKERYISEYVFCNESGGQVRNIRTGFKNSLRRAGIKDFRFHDLRHTFASHLVMSGVDLNTVRELLGHKKIEMTLRYAHLSQGHKSRAVEALGQRIDTIWTPNTKKLKKDKLYISEVIDTKEEAEDFQEEDFDTHLTVAQVVTC